MRLLFTIAAYKVHRRQLHRAHAGRFAGLLFVLSAAILTSATAASQELIRLNQLGFYTYGPKIAVAIAPENWYFTIRSPDLATTYFTGELSPLTRWSRSGEEVKSADFSAFTRKGTYVVHIVGLGASYPFTISDNTFTEVTRGLIKAYYYQRASTALPARYAGAWDRNAGHPDQRVVIHPSAQSDPSKSGARTAGEVYASPKGWYDAGDYGKYTVNAGITVYQLLLLYEQFSGYFDSFNLTIPESDNTLPDLLDEIKWELDWLLTMQDPADGGVYHKVTSKSFGGDVMPDGDNDTRYFIGKGTAATFDFAAVCAVACRVYKNILPQFADSCLQAARSAWKWGETFPDSTFKNPPDVVTGEYRDAGLKDEHAWAAYELFLATGDSTYLTAAKTISAAFTVPGWPAVGLLGLYSMALVNGDSTAKSKITALADGLVTRTAVSPYRTSISSEFYWGSNSVAANQGMVMLVAYLITRNCTYLEGAIHACDYLLGRNPLGYSFVTGYGIRSPLHPHHRPSTADNVAAPVPGFLVGGPNASAGDGCTQAYPKESAKSWLDQACSYSTNEVAINWNAPLAFLAGGIDAVFSTDTFDLSPLRNKYVSNSHPPREAIIEFISIGANFVTLTAKSSEPTIKNIVYGTVSDLQQPIRRHIARSDSAYVILSRLQPGTVYYYKTFTIDRFGTFSSTTTDSFRTDDSPLTMTSIMTHRRGRYQPGAELELSFDHDSAISARLLYAQGGSAARLTLPFTKSGTTFTAVIPASDITEKGLTYSFVLSDTSDNLSTPVWSMAPDSFTLTTPQLCPAKAFTMVSFPGIFRPAASSALLGPVFGDTSQWRYFGYDPDAASYTLFDTLRSGFGGWLYSKTGSPCTHSARSTSPDSLYPVTLRRGWNCVGNPFPFPVLWANSLIDLKDARIRITDSAAFHFVRRQIFRYRDTLVNRQHSATYLSNRELDSHIFDDSVTLDPWESWWVYAERDSTFLLLDPHAELQTTSLLKKRPSRERSWFCTVRVNTADAADGPVVFGSSEGALDGYDFLDSPKPPSPAGRITAAFAHDDWNTASRLFAADITGITEVDHRRWELTVVSARRQPVTLTWNTSGPSSGMLHLVDQATGSMVAMTDSGSYSFTPESTGNRHVIAFIQSVGDLPGTPQPARWSFSRIGGTGFRFAYNVPAGMPGLRQVAIAIFDLYGRRITTISNAAHAPGRYTASWNGTANGTGAAAHGLYIARLTGDHFTKSISLNHCR